MHRVEVKCNANTSVWPTIGAQNCYCQPMRQHQMMCCLPGYLWLAQTRSMFARLITREGTHLGLIERNPLLHPISQATRNNIHILCKNLCSLPAGPTANLILQRLRQIPVIER